MNPIELRTAINNTKGQIFTVTFTKKDGTTRVMNCRTGVAKHLKGGKSTISNHDNLISVYDLQSKGYRCFDINSVTRAKINGKTIIIHQ